MHIMLHLLHTDALCDISHIMTQ